MQLGSPPSNSLGAYESGAPTLLTASGSAHHLGQGRGFWAHLVHIRSCLPLASLPFQTQVAQRVGVGLPCLDVLGLPGVSVCGCM